MPLPKIDVPVYTVKVPSSNKEIRVRPFTVKEHKLLLISVESGDINEQINTVKQIINNCIVEGEFDVDKAPFFDVDYLYIFLHSKSLGEKMDVKLTCRNTINQDGDLCNHTFNTKLDIGNYEFYKDEDIELKIKLDKDKGVCMKYPTYYAMKKIEEANKLDQKTVLIINSIDYIWDKKTMHYAKDSTSEDLKAFVEQLTEENYNKLEHFVDNFPTFVAKVEADCPACGFHHVVRYTDFQDFFY